VFTARYGLGLPLKPTGYYMYCQVLHSQILRSAHTVNLGVFCVTDFSNSYKMCGQNVEFVNVKPGGT
jgi:hypothetical protein